MKLLTVLSFFIGLCLASLVENKPAEDAWKQIYTDLCQYHHSTLGFAVILEMYTLQDATLIQRLALTDFPQGRLSPSIFIRSNQVGRVIRLQDDICQFWIPNDGVMLLDSVDPLRDILPVMRSTYFLSHWRYYMLPLFVQYIFPVVLGQRDLLHRELTIIRSIAPFIDDGFSFIFARLNFALNCWDLTNKAQAEAFRMRMKNELVNNMHFKESVVFPTGTLNLEFAAKDETFVFSVLKIAGIWGLNLSVIAHAMAPFSRLARACLAKPTMVALLAKEPLTCLGLAACITRISPHTVEQLISAFESPAYCTGVSFHLSS